VREIIAAQEKLRDQIRAEGQDAGGISRPDRLMM
jgi:hypothetical protein